MVLLAQEVRGVKLLPEQMTGTTRSCSDRILQLLRRPEARAVVKLA